MVAAAVATVFVVLAGGWVTGAVVTEDARVAMVLTVAWFAIAGAGTFAVDLGFGGPRVAVIRTRKR